MQSQQAELSQHDPRGTIWKRKVLARLARLGEEQVLTTAMSIEALQSKGITTRIPKGVDNNKDVYCVTTMSLGTCAKIANNKTPTDVLQDFHNTGHLGQWQHQQYHGHEFKRLFISLYTRKTVLNASPNAKDALNKMLHEHQFCVFYILLQTRSTGQKRKQATTKFGWVNHS